MPDGTQTGTQDKQATPRRSKGAGMPIASVCWDIGWGLIILSMSMGVSAGILHGLLRLCRVIG